MDRPPIFEEINEEPSKSLGEKLWQKSKDAPMMPIGELCVL